MAKKGQEDKLRKAGELTLQFRRVKCKPPGGAIWRIDPKKPLKGPFSIRLTSEGGAHLVQDDVIPADWKPNTVYTSKLQF
ncbi:hypothetical protein PR202_gb18296 [Eleusine coracana subsp. coracana]|uniref:Expansin-like CBD domain-containing protein n=1 Tax=Eleusine coracana subsp. coracana TaxID=191504 RepID=A0AAV5F5S6_ELECO|nr:hypothetical protein PR202_gb18296 [Eleusine coracana subsp. coracana]